MLKPLDGNHGRDFYPISAVESRGGEVLVERFVAGEDYRVLVIDTRVVAVVEGVPAQVVGDGEHTVRQLVDLANADPR